MCQDADLFTKPLGIQKCYSMRRQFSMQCDAIRMLEYTVSVANYLMGNIICFKAKMTRKASC